MQGDFSSSAHFSTLYLSPSFYFFSAKQVNKTHQYNNAASTGDLMLAFGQFNMQKVIWLLS